MRWKISRDWTADPPGELICIATVPSAAMEKARSSGEATAESDRPGRKGVLEPITPDMRSTGTRGPFFRSLSRNLLIDARWKKRLVERGSAIRIARII